MSAIEEVRGVLDEALGLDGRSRQWDEDTVLLGNVPELTSLAVVNVLLALEERMGIVVADDEMDAEVFATLGNLARFVESKLVRVDLTPA
jgi:acyl carrier protein